MNVQVLVCMRNKMKRGGEPACGCAWVVREIYMGGGGVKSPSKPKQARHYTCCQDCATFGVMLGPSVMRWSMKNRLFLGGRGGGLRTLSCNTPKHQGWLVWQVLGVSCIQSYLLWVGGRSGYTSPIVLPVFPQRGTKLAINQILLCWQ